jgi:hypothetical protein
LFILTPFFDKHSLDQILKGVRPNVKLRFILGFNLKNLLEAPAASKNCEVIRAMVKNKDSIEAKQIVNLHAKIYLFDAKIGIVTSRI